MRVLAVTAWCALAAVVGCGSGDSGAPRSSSTAARASTRPRATATSTAAAASAGTAPAGYRDENLPVSADFEQDAEREITPDNFEAKLAEIQQELGVTPAPSGSGRPAASAPRK
ncbi:MAG: hypothetical protein IT373_00855 [Polyangiaceae bacterium]|nr:hypothetical protein [Polyangiaceae bacterium]